MGKTKIKVVDLSQPEEEKKIKEKIVRGDTEGMAGDGERVFDSERLRLERGAPSSARSEVVTSEDVGWGCVPAGPATKTGPRTKVGKPSKKYRSKKYKEAAQQIDPNQRYKLDEAIELAQKTSYSKFGGSIEAHINTAVKNIRGSVSLPHLSGKKITILAFPPSSKTTEGQAAQMEKDGVVIGNDETISEIEKGKVNFDIIIASPQWMPKLAKVAKVLGPKGLMPNPKNDTVTENLAKAISERRTGKTEYKTENNGQVIHLAVGSVSQEKKEIESNIRVLYNTIGKSKITKITLATTMGPGIKVDPSSI